MSRLQPEGAVRISVVAIEETVRWRCHRSQRLGRKWNGNWTSIPSSSCRPVSLQFSVGLPHAFNRVQSLSCSALSSTSPKSCLKSSPGMLHGSCLLWRHCRVTDTTPTRPKAGTKKRRLWKDQKPLTPQKPTSYGSYDAVDGRDGCNKAGADFVMPPFHFHDSCQIRSPGTPSQLRASSLPLSPVG